MKTIDDFIKMRYLGTLTIHIVFPQKLPNNSNVSFLLASTVASDSIFHANRQIIYAAQSFSSVKQDYHSNRTL